ncbi:GNAT family N-acetyltransferase [Hymenobacter jeollabukensis]|uniref:GNAT family N-acetyltransferase n=1 Tax=Hymenobacter jeollabukensis TaxID=2025313 RepID=A0A5R8WV17_9BACT|nr:GNAT family N-acetyltransferase [Hymenobacter jeollabukensis]
MPGDMLDFYLSQGYYRMHQDLFTCRFLPLDGSLYTVHWLRLALADVVLGAEQRRLLRVNARFTLRSAPFRLTEEYEELYARYRASIDFDAPETVEAFTMAGHAHSVFPTEVLEVRDGERLIAVGIFDRGTRSLMGIMNFYDPAYRKYSLGKYLMLRKIELAREQGLAYYYPGYVVHQYPKFDYKLYPCPAATEVFDVASSSWLPFSWDTVAAQSADLLRDWPLPTDDPDEAD